MSMRCALAIGLGRVNPRSYAMFLGGLDAAEGDARAMATLARTLGFDCVETLLSEDATTRMVTERIQAAAARLRQSGGGLFVLTFSGHGLQFVDSDFGSTRERDKHDETWCLYDGPWLDDEIRRELCAFDDDVRVFVVSDSCSSGTVTQLTPESRVAAAGLAESLRVPPPGTPLIPDTLAFELESQLSPIKEVPEFFRQHIMEAYGSSFFLRLRALVDADAEPEASVLLLAACKDGQTTRDGVFTRTMLAILENGRFTGTYDELLDELRSRLVERQEPQLFPTGHSAPFSGTRVFSL